MVFYDEGPLQNEDHRAALLELGHCSFILELTIRSLTVYFQMVLEIYT